MKEDFTQNTGRQWQNGYTKIGRGNVEVGGECR